MNLTFFYSKELLEFDEKDKIINISTQRAILLLMSACLSRGLVTTVNYYYFRT